MYNTAATMNNYYAMQILFLFIILFNYIYIYTKVTFDTFLLC